MTQPEGRALGFLVQRGIRFGGQGVSVVGAGRALKVDLRITPRTRNREQNLQQHRLQQTFRGAPTAGPSWHRPPRSPGPSSPAPYRPESAAYAAGGSLRNAILQGHVGEHRALLVRAPRIGISAQK